MAVAQAYSGTATIGTTEWSLTTGTAGPDADTTANAWQCFLDLSAVANGDVYEWRLYEKIVSGGTQRLVTSARIANAQGAAHWASPVLMLIHGWDMTLVKISGTDRSITWSIRKAG